MTTRQTLAATIVVQVVGIVVTVAGAALEVLR